MPSGGDARHLLNGALLCGGRSSRFGSDKALALIAGEPMALRPVRAMRSVGADPVLAVASDVDHGGRLSAALAVPTVADRWPGQGPLGGLVTAMLWFRQGLILTLPCDLPLITGDALAPLVAAAEQDPTSGVVAVDERGPNCTIGVWPAELGPELKKLFDAGARRLDTVLDLTLAQQVELDARSIEDADTPADLTSMTSPEITD